MLELIQVTKRYAPDAPPALEDVSFSVREGEFVAVLGLSGVGKTTLVRCVNGLVRPEKGRILLEGRDLVGLRERDLRAVRRRIGMVFQQFHLIDRLDALTNVLVGSLGRVPPWRAALRRFPKPEVERARAALERVGMADYAARRVSQLSGGQRQRVGIARALAQQPRLLLADEPVSSLDPVTARQIMDLLAEISREQRLTTLVNLHDVSLAREYARRIIGLAAARVAFDGPVEALDGAILSKIFNGRVPTGEPPAPAPRARSPLEDELAEGGRAVLDS